MSKENVETVGRAIAAINARDIDAWKVVGHRVGRPRRGASMTYTLTTA
jgi:hypothetical protein